MGKRADVRTTALAKALEEAGYKGVKIGPSFVAAFFDKKQPRVVTPGGSEMVSAPALWKILDIFDASTGGGCTGEKFHMYGVIKGIFNQAALTFRVRHDPTEDAGVKVVTVPIRGDEAWYRGESETQQPTLPEKSQLEIECERAGISVEEWKKRFGRSLPDNDEEGRFVTEQERLRYLINKDKLIIANHEKALADEAEKRAEAIQQTLVQYYGE